VLVAGASFLAATLPHFLYHVTTTESFSTADNAASLGAFVLEMVVVALAMAAAGKGAPDDTPRAV
jgi:ABC-type phosphate transport system permease subunit